MKFKSDENLRVEVADLLNQEGHDALSVTDQQLAGHPGRLWIVEESQVRIRDGNP